MRLRSVVSGDWKFIVFPPSTIYSGSQSLKGGITFYALEVLAANTMLWQKVWFFQ